jgi:DNA-binding PadR family transcriptional regulator
MRLSLQTLRVLQVFMEDPGEPRYGLELMDRTALKSGTIYPALHRLESEGWLRSWSEPVDSAEVGRPARRLYALTPTGLASAERALGPFREAPRPRPGTLHPRARLA